MKTNSFKSVLRKIAEKHAAKHADITEIDLVFDSDIPKTDEQLVRALAEHPVAINNLLPYLAEVQTSLGLKTKPILKSMISNMDKVKAAFPKEYETIMSATGSRDVTVG